ncbi:hypothetical protein KY362_07615, partial [Candidatus Woesearchaeota archaeon]|nr:hypothetical protein [Candidatus Woesearchaeota archaeon]
CVAEYEVETADLDLCLMAEESVLAADTPEMQDYRYYGGWELEISCIEQIALNTETVQVCENIDISNLYQDSSIFLDARNAEASQESCVRYFVDTLRDPELCLRAEGDMRQQCLRAAMDANLLTDSSYCYELSDSIRQQDCITALKGDTWAAGNLISKAPNQFRGLWTTAYFFVLLNWFHIIVFISLVALCIAGLVKKTHNLDVAVTVAVLVVPIVLSIFIQILTGFFSIFDLFLIIHYVRPVFFYIGLLYTYFLLRSFVSLSQGNAQHYFFISLGIYGVFQALQFVLSFSVDIELFFFMAGHALFYGLFLLIVCILSNILYLKTKEHKEYRKIVFIFWLVNAVISGWLAWFAYMLSQVSFI